MRNFIRNTYVLYLYTQPPETMLVLVISARREKIWFELVCGWYSSVKTVSTQLRSGHVYFMAVDCISLIKAKDIQFRFEQIIKCKWQELYERVSSCVCVCWTPTVGVNTNGDACLRYNKICFVYIAITFQVDNNRTTQ